jgi:hypothetical protein
MTVAGGVACITAVGEVVPSGECSASPPAWIWCDDFEEDLLTSYFEYDDADGNFVRIGGVGRNESFGMRARFDAAQVSAGFLHLAMGETPQSYMRPVDDGTAVYREVYWRMFVRNEPSWFGGGGNKLSRAFSFGSPSSFAQAMVGHVWAGNPPNEAFLVIDPASGTDEAGNLLTTKYNDFEHFRWLGARTGVTPIFDNGHVGNWHCVEARIALNDADQSNGVFELWVNGALEASRYDLNWVGAGTAYGINAIYFENYWNAGSPATQERYFDNVVVSTDRIGC